MRTRATTTEMVLVLGATFIVALVVCLLLLRSLMCGI